MLQNEYETIGDNSVSKTNNQQEGIDIGVLLNYKPNDLTGRKNRQLTSEELEMQNIYSNNKHINKTTRTNRYIK